MLPTFVVQSSIIIQQNFRFHYSAFASDSLMPVPLLSFRQRLHILEHVELLAAVAHKWTTRGFFTIFRMIFSTEYSQ